MLAQIRPASVLTLLLSVLTGLLYPLAITVVAQAAFPYSANGSPVARDGVVVGSALIGQNFTRDSYFWPRPSATGPDPYNAAASSGSNLGPTSKALSERVAASLSALTGAVPADAVTTSGSGLDPDISPQNAAFQIARVAGARGLDPASLTALVTANTALPIGSILGEPRVNVLALNLALDSLATTH